MTCVSFLVQVLHELILNSIHAILIFQLSIIFKQQIKHTLKGEGMWF